ncbi:MAG: hypothetical protein GDA50_07985, partial [Alphaproteobacteria bacterium GM202ARS2]|nr:hypothetical protein [Alphaproteobacteria bacterium GM202ARS2]
MPIRVDHPQQLMRAWRELPKNSRLLVSKDNELVERRMIRPGFLGRLFGRKVRFAYRVIDPEQEKTRRLADNRVLSPEESRRTLANNLIMHATNTLKLGHTSNPRLTDTSQTNAINRFIRNLSIYVNQTILGNQQGNNTIPRDKSATALDSTTVQKVFQNLEQKIDYLKVQSDKASQSKPNDFDKKSFVYNSIFEMTDLSGDAEPASPQEFYKVAHNLYAINHKDPKIGTSTENTQAFATALKEMAHAFFQQNNIRSNFKDETTTNTPKTHSPPTPYDNPSVGHMMRFIDRFIANTENETPNTKQKMMQAMLDNLPEALADITYETDTGNATLTDPHTFHTHMQQFFPQIAGFLTLPDSSSS